MTTFAFSLLSVGGVDTSETGADHLQDLFELVDLVVPHVVPKRLLWRE